MIRVAIALTVLCALAACDTMPTNNPEPSDTTITLRANIRPDSATGWLYYAIEGDSIVPPEDSATSAWDIRFPYIFCCGKTKEIPIQLNSGTIGPGSTLGAVVTARFENITTRPTTLTLRPDSKADPVVPLPVLGSNVFFVYDIATHTLRPSADRVLLLRTVSGKYYKFQVTSIYQDAVQNPTQESPIGFYHFRSAQIAN